MRRPLAPVPPPDVDACHALLAYEGAAREVIARLKYRNARASAAWLADAMAALVDDPVDAVTWVPTTGARRRDRGFDQAEVLARQVARRLRRPCRRLLSRGAGAPQTGAGAAARHLGPALTPRRRAPGIVLLVDDVTTTGATLSSAARALRLGGAARVVAVVAGRTPPPGALH
jgi:predicted amidophosphoribosyltransferase